MDGIELEFTPEVLDYIVDKAVEYKLGARGLRSIMETLMMQLQFDAPSSKKKNKKIVITKEYAQERLENSLLQESMEVR